LAEAGIEVIQDLAKSSIETLTEMEGIGQKKAASLIEAAKNYLTPTQKKGK
jgi:transcription termination factor NusA